jgi:hypothetical protein
VLYTGPLPAIIMKYVVAIFCLSLLVSCNQEKTIEGSWIYVSSFTANEKPSSVMAQRIFEFDNGKLKEIKLGDHASGNILKVSERIYNYSLENDLLIIDWGTEVDTAQFHLNDSMVLSFSNQEQKFFRSIVLKKIDLSKKFSQKLEGSYEMKWPEDSMYISFINDSICINQTNQAGKWRIFNYEGTSLFIHHYYFFPVASIWDDAGDSIHLTYHLKPNRKVSLVKEDEVFIKQNLIGKWRISKAIAPPPPGFAEGEFELTITIDTDTLAINYWNGTKKEPWELTEDGRSIYFPNKVLSKDGVWTIIPDFENDSIVITREKESRTWYKITAGNNVYDS